MGESMGSEGSAAGGGSSDLSDGQRSTDDEGVRAEEDVGHRNRTPAPREAENAVKENNTPAGVMKW